MRERLEQTAQDLLAGPQRRDALADVDALEAELAAAFVLGLVVAAQRRALLGVVAALPEHVEQPRRDELDVGLGALGLEEALQAVVAVALGGHRPELADDADARLDLRAVDLDRAHQLANAVERERERAVGLER